MTPDSDVWTYSDNYMMLAGFLVAAIAALGGGFVAVVAGGAEYASGASVLLSLGVFLVVFAVPVLVPRLTRRGARCYRLLANRPLGEVEREIRDALEASGRSLTVRAYAGRWAPAARIVSVDGAPWAIRIEATSRREAAAASPRTEIVQVRVRGEADADAREVREMLTARLAAYAPTAA
jgi:hypothetical protein